MLVHVAFGVIPDTNLSQLEHALQTAEAARRDHPELDWLHLTCLIHDMGKIFSLDKDGKQVEPQWAVVGDTFPVGCAFDFESNQLPASFKLNPDSHDAKYNTKLGIYEKHCGLDNVKMSFGNAFTPTPLVTLEVMACMNGGACMQATTSTCTRY